MSNNPNKKSAHDPTFHDPRKQRNILTNGTREDLIEWLIWNDPNGVWSDSDSVAEGKIPISIEQARKAMRRMLTDNRTGSEIVLPVLPADADAATCETWLTQVCFLFGLGFHLDTPASDYVSDDGTALPNDVAESLDQSINRAFTLLGKERPYEVCMEAFEVMMSPLTDDLSNG